MSGELKIYTFEKSEFVMESALTQISTRDRSALHAASTPVVSLLVVIKDQEGQVQSLNEKLYAVMESYGCPFEIIYVDDGSSDKSWAELTGLKQHFPFIKLVKMRTAFGEASVLDAALNISSGEKIVYFTCRVHVNPDDLIKLLLKLDEGYDLVIGKRYPRRDSKLNQWVSKLFNGITNVSARMSLSDINSGVMAIRRLVLDTVPFYGNLNAFLPVMASRQGFKITEETVEQLSGRFNQSLFVRDYIRRFLDLISVLFLRNYTKKPLHFLGYVGAIFTLTGAAINLYLFVYRLIGIGGIAGKPMLLLGTLFFVIGLQMVSIGLLGEIIIYTHAKDIKDYNIEEVIE